MYACINCLKRSSVGVTAGAVGAGAVGAGAGAAGPGAAGPNAAGAEPGAGEPKSISGAMKPLDSVDLLDPLGADFLDVTGADPLATPWVAAPRTEAQRRKGAIYSGDGERNFLPSKQAG